jgi:hypothetical protein
MAAAGAFMGNQKHQEEVDQEDRMRKLRAAEQGVSWASGQKEFSPIKYAGSQMGDIFQGGLSGFATGSNINAASGPEAMPQAQPDAASGTGYLGGNYNLQAQQDPGVIGGQSIWSSPYFQTPKRKL